MAAILETDATNNVVYRTMTVEDVAAVTRTVASAFFEGEPVTVIAGKATLRDMTDFCNMYVPRMAEEGNTVVAFDGTSHEVLGAFLNEDFANADPPLFDKFMAQTDGLWLPCINMIDELEHKLAETFHVPPAPSRPPGRWFHLWMLGVAPAGRGRGIAKKLAAHSIARAKARGFEIAFAECTGALSTHIMQANGAERIAFCDYATWEGDHADSLRSLPGLGHPGMSMMAVKL